MHCVQHQQEKEIVCNCSKGQTGSTCMGPLASEITFAEQKIISRSKTTLVLARIEF